VVGVWYPSGMLLSTDRPAPAPRPRSWGRLVIGGGVAVVTALLLAGCPASDDAEPACEQPSPGTVSTTCDDYDSVRG
jgi:hypothetical protein